MRKGEGIEKATEKERDVGKAITSPTGIDGEVHEGHLNRVSIPD